MAHVAQWKKEIVEELVENMKKYNVIGIFDVNNLPSLQLQRMRKTLKEKGAKIQITKKNLLRLAFEKAKKFKPGIEKLIETMNGQIGILFTNENPFSLYKIVKKSKTTTFAKPGQIAPSEIMIKAGPTPFAPGPIIGELGQFGIKSGVEKGKVAIKKDAVVAKPGDVISAKLAEILRRFGIEPIEVGLNIHSVFEEGITYDKKLLDINEQEYIDSIILNAKDAIAFTLTLGYTTKENIDLLIAKASKETKALSNEIEYISNDSITELLIKGTRSANVINNLL